MRGAVQGLQLGLEDIFRYFIVRTPHSAAAALISGQVVIVVIHLVLCGVYYYGDWQLTMAAAQLLWVLTMAAAQLLWLQMWIAAGGASLSCASSCCCCSLLACTRSRTRSKHGEQARLARCMSGCVCVG